jgi:cytochrome d ubiquinol oxidase subunit I
MDDLMSVVDWSRWQFALTAMYHWLFVPLTLGLSLIVAIMESIYLRTRDSRWLAITKFWMLLFGINFACGVATGIILEFEFGTNWSNYSWFVGDIFGAPLAIEGLLAFFMESTFIAVMFFGWKKVSPKFHLAATWLTTLGASISALWILVANGWMQYPAGMEFDPDQMRNVMVNFWDVALSPVAINKFCHAVLSGWTLSGVFVIGVSCWFLIRKRRLEFAMRSIKIGGWVGTIGILLTLWTGDGSAVEVAKTQPMKLAAMEGLWHGSQGQSIVGLGILNTDKQLNDNQEPFSFEVSVPYGLSLLARHDVNAFVPGIEDIINGVDYDAAGNRINTVSYAERISMGKQAHEALRAYDCASAAGDEDALADALQSLQTNYKYFGYGYLDKPEQAIPPLAMTFYSFRIMVIAGGYLLLFFVLIMLAVYRFPKILQKKWMQWVAMLTIPVVWVCSQSGWITAEVGRQPWIIQDLMPVRAAISDISATSVQITFWMFATVFTLLLVAEISIMLRQISKASHEADESKHSDNNVNE